MVNTTFSVQPRTQTGKAVKQLRRNRQVPAQIMGLVDQPISIVFPEAAFARLYETVGDSGLVYITVEGESTPRPVMVEELQVQPITGQILHVLFRQVNLKEKIEAEVPVVLVNDEKEVPGTVLILVSDVIEVEALPTDLPEKFEIDVAGLTEVGQVITYADLKFDSAKITLMLTDEEKSNPIVMRQAVKEEKEEVAVEAEAAETPEAAAAPAEGDKKD